MLANKYHPDKNNDPSSASKFIAITEAYDTLNHRNRRTQYDLRIWEALKRKQSATTSFTSAPPIYESTRSRRNKAQQKRSEKYHQSLSKFTKIILLIWECLCILSRYLLHIMGITLIAVIITSAYPQISAGFESGIATGLSIFALVCILFWTILKLAQFIFNEVQKDITLFSIYYKISYSSTTLLILPIFIVILILYIALLKSY